MRLATMPSRLSWSVPNASFYRWTCQMAALGTVPDEGLGVFRAMVDNRAQADYFTALMAGVVRMESFWSDDNLARVFPGQPPRTPS
jgi:hypothetical protein